MKLTEKEAYKLAGLILEGHCIDGIELHKVQQLSDKIVAVITQYDSAMDCAIASEKVLAMDWLDEPCPPEFQKIIDDDFWSII